MLWQIALGGLLDVLKYIADRRPGGIFGKRALTPWSLPKHGAYSEHRYETTPDQQTPVLESGTWRLILD